MSEVDEVADRDELLRILTVRARDGNVAAVKTLLDELRREADAGDNGSEFDELDNVTPIRREA
jgi:hypothetical protein